MIDKGRDYLVKAIDTLSLAICYFNGTGKNKSADLLQRAKTIMLMVDAKVSKGKEKEDV